MISLTDNSLEQQEIFINELEGLTSKPGNLTKKEEHRHSFLLSAIAGLRQGKSVAEIRAWEEERLLKAAGLPRAPQRARTKLAEDIEKEWRDFAAGSEVRLTARAPEREIRANEAGAQAIVYTQQSMGTFVPQGMYPRAFATMKQYDEVFDERFCNICETDAGNAMPFPVWDDVSNASVQVGETLPSNEVDVANFSATMLNAYSFRSKVVAVSIELLEDSDFPWPAILERVFAMRHARGVGQALVNGSGIGAPTGLVTAVIASGASPVIASGASVNDGGSETGSTSIGTQDLNSLFAKLNPMYRRNAVWYMNDGTLEYLQGLLDKMGRPTS